MVQKVTFLRRSLHTVRISENVDNPQIDAVLFAHHEETSVHVPRNRTTAGRFRASVHELQIKEKLSTWSKKRNGFSQISLMTNTERQKAEHTFPFLIDKRGFVCAQSATALWPHRLECPEWGDAIPLILAVSLHCYPLWRYVWRNQNTAAIVTDIITYRAVQKSLTFQITGVEDFYNPNIIKCRTPYFVFN